MRSTIASSFLRITRRISRICPAPRQQQQSFMYWSLASSPSSSLSKLSQNLSKRHPFLQYRFASSHMTRADEKELEWAKESSKETIIGLNERDVLGGLYSLRPPFKLVSFLGGKKIFKRKHGGETIQVEVYNMDKDIKKSEKIFSYIVTVFKGDGLGLEFRCVASSDGLTIDSMIMREREESSSQTANGALDWDDSFSDDNRDFEMSYWDDEFQEIKFSDLDEILQRGFYQYLEARGITVLVQNVRRRIP